MSWDYPSVRDGQGFQGYPSGNPQDFTGVRGARPSWVVSGNSGIYRWSLDDCWTSLYRWSSATFVADALGPITASKAADGDPSGLTDTDILFIQIPPDQLRAETMSSTFWLEVGFSNFQSVPFAGDPLGAGLVVLPSTLIRTFHVLHSNLTNPAFINDVRAYSFLPSYSPFSMGNSFVGGSPTHGSPQAGTIQISQLLNSAPIGNRVSLAIEPESTSGGMLAFGIGLDIGWGGQDPDEALEASVSELISFNLFTRLGAREIS